MNKTFEELEKLLKKDDRFVSKDGKVMRNAVYEAANKMDEKLISLLLSDESIANLFFKKVNKVYVFDKQNFNFVINNREMLPDSYTRYKQDIGLVNSREDFISATNDVVLSFPFKDCVLEFDSTDPDEKREEIFFNEVLAYDEIDHLFSDKVLTNATFIDKKGEKEITKLDDNSNLLIKGNNLLAMHSLLKRYKGQVKLMYWDILYNTESDHVPYADTFKHSSWLTMMKNRLDVAKKLLRDDGVICLQCDDNEMAYLKVLCDEIFGRENVFNCICVKMSDPSGPKMAHINKKFPKLKEYIIMCKKNKININKVTEGKNKWDDEYRIFFDLEYKYFDKIKNRDLSKKDIDKINEMLRTNVISLDDAYEKYNIKKDDRLNYCKKNAYRIARSSNSSSVQKQIENISNKKDNMLIKFNDNYIFVKTNYDKKAKTPRVQYVFAEDTMNVPLCDLWTEINTSFNSEGGVVLKNGQKPEKLLYYIIKSLSNESDLVLDAYFGTGTTGAVAMKMGRRFIGIEQLDSHIELAKTRLKNVIDGDETGISKTVGWKGGGSFTYCELKKLNEEIIDDIKKTKNKKGLMTIYNKIIGTGFISYYVDIEKVKKLIESSDDKKINDIKKILIEILDKNQLYVNYEDMDDSDFIVSNNDKKFSKSFYNV